MFQIYIPTRLYVLIIPISQSQNSPGDKQLLFHEYLIIILKMCVLHFKLMLYDKVRTNFKDNMERLILMQ